MNKHTHKMLDRLQALGLSSADAYSLRRISMTLHRWHELECGDSNDYYSFCLVRGNLTSVRVKSGQGLNVRQDSFEHDDSGKPYLERHENRPTRADGNCRAYWSPIPDREAGAKRRLAKILKSYPGLQAYIQTDPRGAALYIYRAADLKAGNTIDSCYSSIGVAVFK